MHPLTRRQSVAVYWFVSNKSGASLRTLAHRRSGGTRYLDGRSASAGSRTSCLALTYFTARRRQPQMRTIWAAKGSARARGESRAESVDMFRSGTEGSTSTVCWLPFTVSFKEATSSSIRRERPAPGSAGILPAAFVVRRADYSEQARCLRSQATNNDNLPSPLTPRTEAPRALLVSRWKRVGGEVRVAMRRACGGRRNPSPRRRAPAASR